MNRNKTARLLKEWKSFLNEGGSKKFKEKDLGKKVIVKDCCGECHKTHKNVPEEGQMTGKLEVINLPDIQDVNNVLVSIDGKKGKHFPECCVNLAK